MSRTLIMIAVVAVLMGACQAAPTATPAPTASPTATASPTPRPTSTPTPTATPTPTPTPTATPRPTPTPTATPTPTPTPFPDLCEGDPDCIYGNEDLVSPITWTPTVSADGLFLADIVIERFFGELAWPQVELTDELTISITLNDQDDSLIASISPPPPAGADWEWTPQDGYYEAETFREIEPSIIRVVALVNPDLHKAVEYACFWNGRDLVNCADISSP